MSFDAGYTLVIPSIAIVAVVGIIVRVRMYRIADFTIDDMIPRIQPIDKAHLKDLLHPYQDTHFRERLSPHRFRLFQHKRILLSLLLLQRMKNNIKHLRSLGWYELQRGVRCRNQRSRAASRGLLTEAVYCQLLGLRLRVKLHLWLLQMALFPFILPPDFALLKQKGSGNLLYLYRRARRTALILASNYGDDVRARLAEVL